MSGRRINAWLIPLGLVLAGFVGCNLFNPSGSSDIDDADADGLISIGEQRMRDKDFAGAFEAFSAALAEDSSKSLAWHGLAKAVIARDSLPITELIRRAKDLGSLKAGDSMPFLNEGDSVKNRFYRPLLRLQAILMAFHRRDSLGLTDGVFASSREGNDLLIASNLGLVLKLGDLNRDTIINERDNLLKGVFDSLGSGGIKPSAVSADSFLSTSGDTTGAVNPQKVEDFNTFLEGMGTDVETNRTILEQVASSSGGSSDSESVNAKIDQFLSSAGNSIVFWKINDSLDNDGDGCVDEEVWGDSVDNDGDGIVDEDARVSYIYPVPKSYGMVFANAPDDGIRNDRVNSTSGKYVPGYDDADSGVFQATTDPALPVRRTKAFQNLTWVDFTANGDTAWANTLKDFPAESHDEQVSRTRNRIRLQLLAIPMPERIQAGAPRIGGCWKKMLDAAGGAL